PSRYRSRALRRDTADERTSLTTRGTSVPTTHPVPIGMPRRCERVPRLPGLPAGSGAFRTRDGTDDGPPPRSGVTARRPGPGRISRAGGSLLGLGLLVRRLLRSGLLRGRGLLLGGRVLGGGVLLSGCVGVLGGLLGGSRLLRGRLLGLGIRLALGGVLFEAQGQLEHLTVRGLNGHIVMRLYSGMATQASGVRTL